MLYRQIVWWLKTDKYTKATWILRRFPKLDALLLRLLPRQHLWLYSKWEWSVCRTFNDGPDECYQPWKQYWKSVLERELAECQTLI